MRASWNRRPASHLRHTDYFSNHLLGRGEVSHIWAASADGVFPRVQLTSGTERVADKSGLVVESVPVIVDCRRRSPLLLPNFVRSPVSVFVCYVVTYRMNGVERPLGTFNPEQTNCCGLVRLWRIHNLLESHRSHPTVCHTTNEVVLEMFVKYRDRPSRRRACCVRLPIRWSEKTGHTN